MNLLAESLLDPGHARLKLDVVWPVQIDMFVGMCVDMSKGMPVSRHGLADPDG